MYYHEKVVTNKHLTLFGIFLYKIYTLIHSHINYHKNIYSLIKIMMRLCVSILKVMWSWYLISFYLNIHTCKNTRGWMMPQKYIWVLLYRILSWFYYINTSDTFMHLYILLSYPWFTSPKSQFFDNFYFVLFCHNPLHVFVFADVLLCNCSLHPWRFHNLFNNVMLIIDFMLFRLILKQPVSTFNISLV